MSKATPVSRRKFFALTGAGALALLAAKRSQADGTSKYGKPNVVIIYADDLGYGDVGCYGATKVKTPNIDRLARDGRMFTDAHTAAAVCTPSRYALLTGQYPFRRSIYRPIFSKGACLVNPGTMTVARMLKGNGYATACIGKWHLGFGVKVPNWNGDLKPGPLELGFDYYFGLPVVNSHSPYVLVENHRVLRLDPDDPLVFGGIAPTQPFPAKMIDKMSVSGGKAAHALYKDEELGTTFTNKAIDWIQSHRDGPFFLYFATPQIHHPFTPAPEFKGTSECGPYGDFIHELDSMVGRVVEALEKAGVADNTLLIFTSDNGGMLNQGGQDAWKAGHRLNGDLLGFKFDAWEGGHRVPFIARWPGRIPAGTTSHQLISNVDMLATLAAVVGQELADTEGVDSFNVLPALVDDPKKPIRDHLVLAPVSKDHLALRQGKWLYIGAQGAGGFKGEHIGDHDLGGPAAFVLTHHVNSDIENSKLRADAPPAQLYDLETDLRQTRNIIREHPEKAAELSARLAAIASGKRTRP